MPRRVRQSRGRSTAGRIGEADSAPAVEFASAIPVERADFLRESSVTAGAVGGVPSEAARRGPDLAAQASVPDRGARAHLQRPAGVSGRRGALSCVTDESSRAGRSAAEGVFLLLSCLRDSGRVGRAEGGNGAQRSGARFRGWRARVSRSGQMQRSRACWGPCGERASERACERVLWWHGAQRSRALFSSLLERASDRPAGRRPPSSGETSRLLAPLGR